ncbi:hypothetical protein M407DRAFT_29512 [Tulasnella calospora MUT 4182]|uniref:Uncharacterized protein n=1 Tax=Tulasnella calospora MUT 4182 TaxID=1051891 RepID=A0A0C3KH88_9AGAM|nr:hypothetical protein M407DRAFT_29512 [Tulasnella calospora MUT 4182]
MPSPQNPSRPSPDATPSLLPDSQSSGLSGQTSAMPPAGLHTEQAGRQPLIRPKVTCSRVYAQLLSVLIHHPWQVASRALFHADPTSSTAALGLKDWTTEIRSTVDPIWPDYALPTTDIPSCTARDLGDRLGRIAQVQWAANADVMYTVQPRDWSRTMQMSRGSSPIWMTLIRSRWLVIETLAGYLELWDIEGGGHWDGVLASFKTLVGSVDGAVVIEKAGEPAEFLISTMFSGLKYKRDGWWAFARSEGSNNQGFLVVPHASTPLVRLACANQVAENQNVLDILLRDDIIVVARNRTIDLYSMSDALKLLSTNLSSTSLPFIRIEESFSIPTCNFLHQSRLLRRAPAFYSSFGESGSGMIEVGMYTLNMYFADPRETHRSEGGSPNLNRIMAQWEIPRDIDDVPRCAAFDEATGIVVVEMHSGRLLVADAGSWMPPLPAPDNNSDSSEGSAISQSGGALLVSTHLQNDSHELAVTRQFSTRNLFFQSRNIRRKLPLVG